MLVSKALHNICASRIPPAPARDDGFRLQNPLVFNVFSTAGLTLVIQMAGYSPNSRVLGRN